MHKKLFLAGIFSVLLTLGFVMLVAGCDKKEGGTIIVKNSSTTLYMVKSINNLGNSTGGYKDLRAYDTIEFLVSKDTNYTISYLEADAPEGS